MELESIIESLLFVSPKALTVKEIASFLDKDRSEVEKALKALKADYETAGRGIRLVETAKKYQMASAPDNAKLVQDFLQLELKGDLSPASLETLTIIAYRGPIKKEDLEKIRGINCSLILRNLLIRGLVEEKDDRYSVSLEFMKFLGLSALSDLPDYEKFNQNEEIDKLLKSEI